MAELEIVEMRSKVVEDGQAALEVSLTRIFVEMMLDASTSLPLDVESIHKKILRGPASDKYSRVMSSLGLSSIAPLICKLGTPPLGLLEALVTEISGRVKTFVCNMDRSGLSRYAHVEDTGILIMMRQQQALQAATMAAGVLPLPVPPAMPPAGPRPPPMPPPESLMMPPIAVPGPMPPGPMASMMGMPPAFMPGVHPAQLPGAPPPPPIGMPPIMGMGGPPPPAPPAGMPPIAAGKAGPLPPAPPLGMPPPPAIPPSDSEQGGTKRPRDSDLNSLLKMKTAREVMNVADRGGGDLVDILSKPSAREAANLDRFRTEGGSAIREHCQHLTKEDCRRANSSPLACPRLHFKKLMFDWTDPSLGNCSYLDTCRNLKTCRHIHYQLDTTADVAVPTPGGGHVAVAARPLRGAGQAPKYSLAVPEMTQWINCDIRTFDMSILGKFGVIMADPPWEIHQDLPYGTMADDEMRNLNIGTLQDDGVIFLWVTGRAMELGRECLELWGYKRVDELIWVKTNLLQRLIRTGRTGHWINHSKEHCLVGYKGNLQALNKRVDCDVLVADVRETSRKPDEMYTLLERLSPGTRKIEIFARPNNLAAAHGWIGLGNQLNGCRILEPELREKYIAVYGRITEPDPSKPAP